MISSTIFTCGPFMSASAAIDAVATGIYSALLISESVQSQQAFQQKIDMALSRDATQEEIDNLRREAEYQGGLLDITLAALGSADGADQ